MAEQEGAKLPEDELKKIQSIILDHVQSLNAAGTVSTASDAVTRQAALEALGFAASDTDAEQWLCGADGNCGVKN